MSKAARGLGKGLDALIPQSQADAEKTIQELSVSEIRANQFQPRKEFDDESLEELKESIRQYGVLQPVLVRKTLPVSYTHLARDGLSEANLSIFYVAAIKDVPPS